MTPEQQLMIAEIAHNVTIQYCRALGNEEPPAWEEVDDEGKASICDGIAFILGNPEATPADSHENWREFKKAQGWKYGRNKNLEKKTHPCMRDFDKLPEYQQAKDYIFHSLVRGIASKFIGSASAPVRELPKNHRLEQVEALKKHHETGVPNR